MLILYNEQHISAKQILKPFIAVFNNRKDLETLSVNCRKNLLLYPFTGKSPPHKIPVVSWGYSASDKE